MIKTILNTLSIQYIELFREADLQMAKEVILLYLDKDLEKIQILNAC